MACSPFFPAAFCSQQEESADSQADLTSSDAVPVAKDTPGDTTIFTQPKQDQAAKIEQMAAPMLMQPVYLPFPVFVMPWAAASMAAMAAATQQPAASPCCWAPVFGQPQLAPAAPGLPLLDLARCVTSSFGTSNASAAAGVAAGGAATTGTTGTNTAPVVLATRPPCSHSSLGIKPLPLSSSADTDEATSRCCASGSKDASRWQDPAADQKYRLQVARQIAVLLKRMGLRCAADNARLGSLVRRMEVALYMAAPSVHAYKDVRTLPQRIVSLGKALKKSGLKLRA